jgi:hypothetical protein
MFIALITHPKSHTDVYFSTSARQEGLVLGINSFLFCYFTVTSDTLLSGPVPFLLFCSYSLPFFDSVQHVVVILCLRIFFIALLPAFRKVTEVNYTLLTKL